MTDLATKPAGLDVEQLLARQRDATRVSAGGVGRAMESAPATNTHLLPVEVVGRRLVVTPFWRDAMAEPLVVVARSTAETPGRREFSTSRAREGPVRAGEIGPVRREIIFEPVEEPARPAPAPVEPPPAAPEAPPREPVPAPP